MPAPRQIAIPATYMRGGTSKGVFFLTSDLPEALRAPSAARDGALMRVIGSPDRYGSHIDGMGSATSSTSKVVLISKSQRADCDVDYLFGAVPMTGTAIDWSGNCGNLTSAVGPFAIARGLVEAPRDGIAMVRIWQANIGKRILARVPVEAGRVVELGGFTLDGVAFPAAAIELEFLDPGADAGDEGAAGGSFPSGAQIESIELPGHGTVETTLINLGNPTVFVEAASLGLTGTERAAEVNSDASLLEKLEYLRAEGAVRMGLAESREDASRRLLHTPKIAFIARPAAYTATDGQQIAAEATDLSVRIMSMGKLHHALTGTGAVAVAGAAAIPGTLVSRCLGAPATRVRIGHPAGVLPVGARVRAEGGEWVVESVSMSRSARRLMEGVVYIPET